MELQNLLVKGTVLQAIPPENRYNVIKFKNGLPKVVGYRRTVKPIPTSNLLNVLGGIASKTGAELSVYVTTPYIDSSDTDDAFKQAFESYFFDEMVYGDFSSGTVLYLQDVKVGVEKFDKLSLGQRIMIGTEYISRYSHSYHTSIDTNAICLHHNSYEDNYKDYLAYINYIRARTKAKCTFDIRIITPNDEVTIVPYMFKYVDVVASDYAGLPDPDYGYKPRNKKIEGKDYYMFTFNDKEYKVETVGLTYLQKQYKVFYIDNIDSSKLILYNESHVNKKEYNL